MRFLMLDSVDDYYFLTTFISLENLFLQARQWEKRSCIVRLHHRQKDL